MGNSHGLRLPSVPLEHKRLKAERDSGVQKHREAEGRGANSNGELNHCCGSSATIRVSYFWQRAGRLQICVEPVAHTIQ